MNDNKKVNPEYLNIACEILFSRIFHIGDLEFTVEEVEIYVREDPYTHGHPMQLDVPPDQWYFHRASRSVDAKYKGGTFKGVDITIPNGGCLIRSINIDPNVGKNGNEYPDGLFIEGPCNVVTWILRESECVDIEEFVTRNGLSVRNGNLLNYTNRLDHESLEPNDLGDSNIPDGTRDTIICGPRVGLGFPDDPSESGLAKYKLLFAPLRFHSRFALDFIKKYKSMMIVRPENNLIAKATAKWIRAYGKDYDMQKKPKTVEEWLSAYGTWSRTEFL